MAVACAPVFAQSVWLAITGDATDAGVDTVEVSPDSVLVFQQLRVMKIRVNRASERVGFDELPYRSYLATVQVDCSAKKAHFRQLQLFAGPMRTGADRRLAYAEDHMRQMLFRDMEPNPVARIVLAACTIPSVQSR